MNTLKRKATGTSTGLRPDAGTPRTASRLFKTLLVLALCVGALYGLATWYQQRDYLPYFHERKAQLIRADKSLVTDNQEFQVYDIRFEDANGVQVMAHLKVPATGGPRHPVLITLGGTGAGREVIDYLGDTKNWMILALDYPYRGPSDDLSHWQFLSIVPQARRALLDTVPAGMMVVDYLYDRGDVDTDRIVVAGGSFGALIAPALAATDTRISALAILFGAGDLEKVIAANLPLAETMRPPVAWAGAVIASPFEPLKYIGRIAPRPVFFLSGSEDKSMPVEISRALHDAALEPKTVTWLPLGHVNLGAREFHQQVLDACTEWLQEIGFMTPDEVFVLPEQDSPGGSEREANPD